MTRYILKENKYKQVCSECLLDLEKAVDEKGIKYCPGCGNLHTFNSTKKKDVCESCDKQLTKCGECGKYHPHTYNTEDKARVCRHCYEGNRGDYLTCTRCGVYHKIDRSRVYDTKFYLCSICTDDKGTRLCAICGNYHHHHDGSMYGDDWICGACSSHTCNNCKKIPIRPRRVRIGEDISAIMCSTCASKLGSAVKQNWDYSPNKLYFYDVEGDNDELYIGFENEQIIPRASADESRRDLANVLKWYSEKDIYGVFDGSIGGANDAHGSNGYEIVSHPRTLASHVDVNWKQLFTEKQEVHHTCGMHTHMSRNGFTRAHLLRLMQLVYNNEDFITIVAERVPNEFTQSIGKDSIASDADRWYKPKNARNRRVKVNLCNKHTIELRFYSNVISLEGLMKNLEFTHAMYYYTKATTVVTVEGFLSYVKGKSIYRNLNDFIKVKEEEINRCV